MLGIDGRGRMRIQECIIDYEGTISRMQGDDGQGLGSGPEQDRTRIGNRGQGSGRGRE